MIPKFRFYSKRMNKIGIVISLHPLRKRVYVEWDDALSGTENIDDNGVLIQSTGLFDKNDKEIFEDDIVKTTRFFCRADESGGFYEYEKELIGIVKQLEGAWVIDTEKGAIYLWSDIDENEVLGNIWDNLELLEDLE